MYYIMRQRLFEIHFITIKIFASIVRTLQWNYRAIGSPVVRSRSKYGVAFSPYESDYPSLLTQTTEDTNDFPTLKTKAI